MNRFVRAKLGFSLVELMIVVAIIGVLATIGIPTFRTMVQKAKKSEAKVALGALYTSEVAFFSEYGVYGNLLDKIGFELDGNAGTRTYQTGFQASAGCAGITGAANVRPAAANAGSALNVAFPSYYQGSSFFLAAKSSPTINGGTCFTDANVATDGQTFVATAAASISNKATVPDVWTINDVRVLANVQDGIK